MYRSFFGLVSLTLVLFTAAGAQNKFNGYSLTVRANDTDDCPVRFLPQQNQQNHIEVFLPGTNLQRPATGISACDMSRVTGNRVAPNGADQKWCFEGPEELYEIKLSNGESYLWPTMSNRDIGFYNLKDFRPMRRIDGPTPRYVYSEPADYTKAFRNAMMILASRWGGTLVIPDGDYVVGTTDGNTRDPSFEGITVPTGVTIRGASGQVSNPGNNMPDRSGAARIRLRNNRQSIFRIGGCTGAVAIENIELLGNVALFGEQPRDRTGTYGIEAFGRWARDPQAKTERSNHSFRFRFENVTIQQFEIGLYVHNANEERCDAERQHCKSWPFDFIRVDHGNFVNNNTGISVDTFNTDWNITNSQFNVMAANAPGIGIRLKKGGVYLIQNSFGGGTSYGHDIGGTFLHVDSASAVTVIASSAERIQKTIYYAPLGAGTNEMLTLMGNIFTDPIELSGRMNLVSIGNFYSARAFQVSPQVTVNSIGDKFCHDALNYPGECTDRAGGGNTVHRPGFTGVIPMFRTGRLPEASGKDRIERQPNLFGYDVEISKGLLQYDPDITFRDITAMAAPVDTGTRVKDGALVYCKDCRKTSTGVCSQGQAGVDGAFAKRINGQWRCD